MKALLISQARMGSTRTPGKVLMEVLGKPLLQYQIERLRCVRNVADFVIATTSNEADDDIVRLCQRLGCTVFRGSETDVLGRYYETAKRYHADTVVRVTADCPIIDPLVVEQVLDFYLKRKDSYDYVSNTRFRTFPRGMDTEVFSFQVLEEAFGGASLPYEREHVTPFFYTHPERYRIGEVRHRINLSHHRWTVDTREDFELIRRIISALYPRSTGFSMEDTLNLLEKHPDWTRINSDIPQKTLPGG